MKPQLDKKSRFGISFPQEHLRALATVLESRTVNTRGYVKQGDEARGVIGEARILWDDTRGARDDAVRSIEMLGILLEHKEAAGFLFDAEHARACLASYENGGRPQYVPPKARAARLGLLLSQRERMSEETVKAEHICDDEDGKPFTHIAALTQSERRIWREVMHRLTPTGGVLPHESMRRLREADIGKTLKLPAAEVLSVLSRMIGAGVIKVDSRHTNGHPVFTLSMDPETICLCDIQSRPEATASQEQIRLVRDLQDGLFERESSPESPLDELEDFIHELYPALDAAALCHVCLSQMFTDRDFDGGDWGVLVWSDKDNRLLRALLGFERVLFVEGEPYVGAEKPEPQDAAALPDDELVAMQATLEARIAARLKKVEEDRVVLDKVKAVRAARLEEKRRQAKAAEAVARKRREEIEKELALLGSGRVP